MTEENRKVLIRDMALKLIEDFMPHCEQNHDLIHHGGGSCMDAAITKLVAINAMAKVANRKVPEDVASLANSIVNDIVEHIDKKNAEAEVQIISEIGNPEPDIDNLIAKIVSKAFGIPLDSIEVQEITIPPSNPKDKEPTSH